MVHIQVLVQTSVDYQGMSHGYALWFHRVLFRVDELAEVLVVKVGHFALRVKFHLEPINQILSHYIKALSSISLLSQEKEKYKLKIDSYYKPKC